MRGAASPLSRLQAGQTDVGSVLRDGDERGIEDGVRAGDVVVVGGNDGWEGEDVTLDLVLEREEAGVTVGGRPEVGIADDQDAGPRQACRERFEPRWVEGSRVEVGAPGAEDLLEAVGLQEGGGAKEVLADGRSTSVVVAGAEASRYRSNSESAPPRDAQSSPRSSVTSSRGGLSLRRPCW